MQTHLLDMIDSVICGDCREVLKDIPDGSVDLVVTDPPYRFTTGGGGIYKDDSPFLVKIRELGTNEFDPDNYIPAILKKLKAPNAYFFCNIDLVRDYGRLAAASDVAFDLLVVERDSQAPNTNNHYPSSVDYVVFMKRGGTFNTGLRPFSIYNKVQRFGQLRGSLHPNEKSVEICRKYIMVSSKPGDLVLDPFCGSGTTLVAAKELGRRYIGIEINPDFARTAKLRLNQLTLSV